jgi:uncharacterized protein (DUF952 family)
VTGTLVEEAEAVEPEAHGPIYHIVVRSELQAGVAAGLYTPSAYGEDGFVHCAQRESVLAIARDYYSDVSESVWLLEIDISRLDAELVLEAPTVPSGARPSHLDTASLFPHVYGPLNGSAITGAAQLGRGDGEFAWPARFDSLAAALA